jgi:hypothetical protein
MYQKRDVFRVTLDRQGRIHRVTEVSDCHVVDLTEKGVQLRIEMPVCVGEVMELEFSLSDTSHIHCMVQINHVILPHVGAAIVRISAEHQNQISRFIDQVNALNVTGF